jgi:hypothetical protein
MTSTTIGKDEAIAIGERFFDNYPYSKLDERQDNRIVEVVAIEGEAGSERFTIAVIGGTMATADMRRKTSKIGRKSLRAGYRRVDPAREIPGYAPPA